MQPSFHVGRLGARVVDVSAQENRGIDDAADDFVHVGAGVQALQAGSKRDDHCAEQGRSW